MIFQKGDGWKVSGHPKRFSTLEEAESFLAKKTVANNKIEAASQAVVEAEAAAHEEKLKLLREQSTPFEKMIARNICLICNLEPCECFTYTKRTEAGL
jgi:hypothetical protein